MTIQSDRIFSPDDGREIPDLPPYLIKAQSEHIDISIILPTTYRWQYEEDDNHRLGLGNKIKTLPNCNREVSPLKEKCEEWAKRWMDPHIEGTDISNKEFFTIWEHTVNTIETKITYTGDGTPFTVPLYIVSAHGILEDLELTIKERGGSRDSKFPKRMKRVKLFQQLLCLNRDVMGEFLRDHKNTYPGQDVMQSLNDVCIKAANNIICSRSDEETVILGEGPALRGYDIKDYSETEKEFIFKMIFQYNAENIKDLLYISLTILSTREITYGFIQDNGINGITITPSTIQANDVAPGMFARIRLFISGLTENDACIMFSNLIREYFSLNDEYIQNTVIKTFILLLDIYTNRGGWDGINTFVECFRYLVYYFYERRNSELSKYIINKAGERMLTDLVSSMSMVGLSSGYYIQIFGGANLSLLLVDRIFGTNDLDFRIHTFNDDDYTATINNLMVWLVKIRNKVASLLVAEDAASRYGFADGRVEAVMIHSDDKMTLLQLHVVLPQLPPIHTEIFTASNNRTHIIELYIHKHLNMSRDEWRINNEHILTESHGVGYYNATTLALEFTSMLTKNMSITREVKYIKRLMQLASKFFSVGRDDRFKEFMNTFCGEQYERSNLDCGDLNRLLQENRGFNTFQFLDNTNSRALIMEFGKKLFIGTDVHAFIADIVQFNEAYLRRFANEIHFPFGEYEAQAAPSPAALQRQVSLGQQAFWRQQELLRRQQAAQRHETFLGMVHARGQFGGGSCRNVTKKRCSKKNKRKHNSKKNKRKQNSKKNKRKQNSKRNKRKQNSKRNKRKSKTKKQTKTELKNHKNKSTRR